MCQRGAGAVSAIGVSRCGSSLFFFARCCLGAVPGTVLFIFFSNAALVKTVAVMFLLELVKKKSSKALQETQTRKQTNQTPPTRTLRAERPSVSEVSEQLHVLFFVWMLHGSTKFVVRAVALLSAKQSEEKSSKMIVDLTSSAVHFSICACHPCAGAMLIFSVSFQFYRMIPEGNPSSCMYNSDAN